MHCSKEGKRVAAAVGWSPLWAVQVANDAQLEAKAQVTVLEEELRLEKDVWLSTTLLASGLAEEVGKQDNRLETLACRFAKLGGCKLQRIKV